MKTKTNTNTILVILFFLCGMGLVTAQTNDVTSTDTAIQSYVDRFTWLKIFIVPTVTVLVMGLRKAIAAIPVQIWPWVTPFLGTALDYVGSKIGIWTSNAEAGVLMGGLAVWFHQLVTQTKELKREGPTPSSTPKPPGDTTP